MSTNLQSKRTSLPEPEVQLDSKVNPQEQDTVSNVTAPYSDEAVNKEEVQLQVKEAKVEESEPVY